MDESRGAEILKLVRGSGDVKTTLNTLPPEDVLLLTSTLQKILKKEKHRAGFHKESLTETAITDLLELNLSNKERFDRYTDLKLAVDHIDEILFLKREVIKKRNHIIRMIAASTNIKPKNFTERKIQKVIEKEIRDLFFRTSTMLRELDKLELKVL